MGFHNERKHPVLGEPAPVKGDPGGKSYRSL